jgi:mono/diheme cytochrome c family protein
MQIECRPLALVCGVQKKMAATGGPMRSRHVTVAAGCLLALAFALGSRVFAQDVNPRMPPLVIKSLAGSDLFDFYCASCHGRGGKGDGPAAPALKTRPPNLTTLARRSGGIFPTARVAASVGGDGTVTMSAHGSTDMPVWGPIFRALDANDKLADARVAAVVTYVQSLQVK